MNAAVNRVVVAALYKFAALHDYRELREPLLDVCLRAAVRGTLLLAPEGINGTIAGSRAGVDRVLAYLRTDSRLADLEPRESLDSGVPFLRMKVKLKREIVTLGLAGVDPNRCVGTYVEPRDWNALVQDPQVLLIDTRNDYECSIGTFRGALDPRTSNFREFPAFVREHLDPRRHRKVAMFCTGGIRCEKASSFMLAEGFEEVYHLRGGILNYLEQIPPRDSTWAGECFVFDSRVAVDHSLRRGSYDQCYGCRHPITEREKCSAYYEKGVSCPRCYGRQSEDQRARFRERQRQVELAGRRGRCHVGAAMPRPVPQREDA